MPPTVCCSHASGLGASRVCATDATSNSISPTLLPGPKPPLVLLPGRTAVPPRLMYPQAPPQFDDRLAAEWPAMFGRPATLMCQQCRDLSDIVSLLHQYP